MPANRKRGLLQAASELQSTGSVDRAGASGGLNTFAEAFSQTAAQVGRIADHAAMVEGARAGRLAGLDPEFRPKRSLTIRAEAYDAAALEIYRVRAKQRFAADMEEAFAEHGNDPAALDNALQAKREAWLKDSLPEVRPDLELAFERAHLTMMRKSARAQAARLAAERKAAATEGVAQTLKELQQQGYDLGLDETADAALAAALADLEAQLSGVDATGEPLYTAKQRRDILETARKEVAKARLFGAFERTNDLEAKRAFAEKFREDFGEGRGQAGHFDFDEFDRIDRRLQADLARAENRREAEIRAVGKEIDDRVKLIEKGYALSEDDRAGLQAKVAEVDDPTLARSLAQLDALAEFQEAARVSRPADLDAFVQAETKALREDGVTGDDDFRVARLELAEKLRAEQRSALKSDPLGYANRVGSVAVPELDFTDAETARASMGARIAAAEQVAAYYGIDPVYLRPAEKTALAATLNAGGAPALQLAGAITQAAGQTKALAVMDELSDEAPEMAFLGAHVARLGGTQAARDAATALELRSELGPDFKPLAPSKTESRRLAVAEMGAALANLPEAESAAIATANAIYETRARRQGVTEFDEELWRQCLREALGEREIAGETYGGIASQGFFGGHEIIVPPIIRQDGFDEALDMITLPDLAAAELGNPVGREGRTVSLERLKGATLVQVGDGRYALATGDPDTPGAEGWVFRDTPGQPYILDFYALAPRLAERRPDLFHMPDTDSGE